jgi:hypothetical protein
LSIADLVCRNMFTLSSNKQDDDDR